MDRQEILNLKVKELRRKLTELHLDSSGKKKEDLQNRLLNYYKDLEKPESVVTENDSFVSAKEFNNTFRSNFTLKDIEESLTCFQGNGHPEIESWLSDFEDNATAVGWNDLQKLIYAKQLMRGAARLYIRTQTNITDWPNFKESLIKEFSQKLTSADRHFILSNKKKKQNESLLEFLYNIIELAKPINLDEASIIQYFTDGIQDARANKTILYEAQTMEELKAKIKIYERISSSNAYSKPFQNFKKKCTHCPHLNNHSTNECKKLNNLCYHCGQKGHKAYDCQQKNKNVNRNANDPKNENKYYNRNENRNNNNTRRSEVKTTLSKESEGRIYQKIDRESGTQTANYQPSRQGWKTDFDTQTKVIKASIRINKTVKVFERYVNFMIDTGSDINLLKESVYKKCLGFIPLIRKTIAINGIGLGQITTLGYFTAEIEVDNIKFTTEMHVAQDDVLINESLLGNSIFKQVEMSVNAEGATFSLREKIAKPENPTFTAGTVFRALCLNSVDMPNDEIDNNELSNPEQLYLKHTIESYSPKKTIESPVEMKIILTDDVPTFQKHRRVPISEQKIIEKQIEEWLEAGIIRESTSQYGSPVVLVPKKDGTKRMCCDYRKLNKKIIRDNFPMTLMDEAIQRLQGATYFTTLDLKNGFFHVKVHEESIKYTAFTTHCGQYEFLYVPFGISNSPAVFCKYIMSIFHNLIRTGRIIIYMDDIIIPSTTIEEGITILRDVLETAEPHGLQFNWTKCQFLRKEVKFLGYIIKQSTIRPSEEKTKAVKNFPEPKDQKSLQRFLGLTSFFRRFIKDYAFIAKPLTDLLCKDKTFKFDTEEKIAFNQLKTALTNSPVLTLFNPNAITKVHTDASKYGYGAVLLQRNAEDNQLHPVEYMSRKTTPAEMNYHSYELEILAVIQSLKKWRCYLIGIRFKIITDCNAFTGTINKTEVPVRVSRWIMFLQDFQYEVEHRAGSRMQHVDALSRIYTLLVQNPIKQKIIEAQNNDDWTKAVKKIVEKQPHEDFFIKYGILHKDFNNQLMVIPKSLEKEIIETAHKQGHFSARKTEQIVAKDFYIPNLQTKTQNFVKSCISCILAEPKSGKREGFLNTVDKSDKPLETLHIDHVGPMETTKKQYNYILTVVDGFSKFTWIFPTKSTTAEETVAKLNLLTSLFGYPKRIISDRGTAFTAKIFQDFCQENDIKHSLITTGVPRGNGQVERIHRIIISVLTKLCMDNKANWYKHTNKVQQYINSTPTRSTAFSPFKILTGLDMRINGFDKIKELLEQQEIEELNNNRDEVRKIACDNIKKIQDENEKAYNKNRKIETNYEINDLVAIKRTQFGAGLKIKPKFLGPYKITKKLRKGRYVVEKEGEGEGPKNTNTVAEYMKPWQPAFEANPTSGRPNVG